MPHYLLILAGFMAVTWVPCIIQLACPGPRLVCPYILSTQITGAAAHHSLRMLQVLLISCTVSIMHATTLKTTCTLLLHMYMDLSRYKTVDYQGN